MPLGLARDSILDLVHLANHHEENGDVGKEFTGHHIVVSSTVIDRTAGSNGNNDFFFADPSASMEEKNEDDLSLHQSMSMIGGHLQVSNSHSMGDETGDFLFLDEDENTSVTHTNTQAGQYSGFSHSYSAHYSSNTPDCDTPSSSVSDPYVAAYEEFGIRKDETGKNRLFCCFMAPWSLFKHQKRIHPDVDADENLRLPETVNKASAPKTTTGEDNFFDAKESSDDEESPSDPDLAMLSKVIAANAYKTSDGLATNEHLQDSAYSQPSVSLKTTISNRFQIASRVLTSKGEFSNRARKIDLIKNVGKDESNDFAGEEKKSDLDEFVESSHHTDERKPSGPKGILKTVSSNDRTGATHNNPSAAVERNVSPQRRRLFPRYEPWVSHMKKRVQFAAMARVVTVRARFDMSVAERCQIWWQRSDYDEFKRAGRIIARALLGGGDEVWLVTDTRQSSQQEPRIKTREEEQYHRSLEHYGGFQHHGEDEHDSSDDKWWCKYGHSRRGLEHIASMEEGQQRQKNVAAAMRAVLDEQCKQRSIGVVDPESIGIAASLYTSWARDLATATGFADADAVRSNFRNPTRDRAHFFRRGSMDSTYSGLSGELSGECPSSAFEIHQGLVGKVQGVDQAIKFNPDSRMDSMERQLTSVGAQ